MVGDSKSSFSSPSEGPSTEGAFLFQTSGTEGEPKWVVCDFWKCREIVDCMWQVGCLRHAVEQTRFPTPPLFHSYGLSAFLEYTRASGSIALPSGSSLLGAVGELRNTKLAQRITAIEGVPYFYAQLASLGGRIPLPALHHAGFGGGSIDETVVGELRERYPQLTYSVRYGLTETPSVVSHKVFSPPYAADWRSSGHPVPAYEVEIVGPDGTVVKSGEEGEILVRGRCVADYSTRALGAPPGVLRTGDIGYINQERELFVVGRRSAFLKYRGYRLSPERIESVFRDVPEVEDCRISMRDDRLVVEVVWRGQALTKLDLLNHASERLPTYAMPEVVVAVDRIPRTMSGKIKRH